jgi:hypothetical protein
VARESRVVMSAEVASREAMIWVRALDEPAVASRSRLSWVRPVVMALAMALGGWTRSTLASRWNRVRTMFLKVSAGR